MIDPAQQLRQQSGRGAQLRHDAVLPVLQHVTGDLADDLRMTLVGCVPQGSEFVSIHLVTIFEDPHFLQHANAGQISCNRSELVAEFDDLVWSSFLGRARRADNPKDAEGGHRLERSGWVPGHRIGGLAASARRVGVIS
jgi:hypothetical protein